MRLTSEELSSLTKYLISELEKKRFSVKTNRYGNILFIEKNGIRCCPAILNSTEDGKQGYAYIQLTVNPYSEKDLGSYYKPRTNKDNNIKFKTNNSVDKYSGKDNHIDMHNFNRVVDDFIKDLNKDYHRISKANEDLALDLDVADEGTCVYKINPNTGIGWWQISVDNYTLKDELIKCISGLFDKYNVNALSPDAYGLYISDIDEVFTDYNFLNCSWSISEPHHGHIVLSFIRPQGTVYDKITISYGGASDVLHIIEDWVKNHQDRMPESLIESVVKIKDTDTVFDGMTGEVESETENKVTVLIDFNDEHKVRNTFKKENIEILED